MRTIERTSQFKKDFKRESRGRYAATLDADPTRVFYTLAEDAPLDVRDRDHALSGVWKDCRDCHVRPDLVLISQKPDALTLRLIRLGSHAEIGL